MSYFYTAESADSYRFAGQTVTLSFYAKKGANFSAASNILVSGVRTGTGTDKVMYGFTGTVEQNQNNTLTTTWQRFTQTVTVASNVTEVALQFYFTPVGTAGADDSISITGVQLELGSVATTFKRSAGGNIQGELAACQRYYLKSYNQATAPATASNTVGNTGYSAISATSTNNRWNVRFPVNMRTTPTITIYSTSTGTSAKIYNEQAAADVDGVTQFIGESGFHLYTSSGSPTAGHQLLAHYQASAEL